MPPIGPSEAGSPPEAPGTAAEPAADSGEMPLVLWAPPGPIAPTRGVGAWALFFAIAGLIAALFVGWGFPINLVAIVVAAVALRRPRESRAVAAWALALGVLGLIYSAGWLVWGATRSGLIG